jgi:FkbM family methyltransferase
MIMQPQLKIKTTPNKSPVDTIVHLGAGRCSELDDYLAQQPRQLLLVEADPQMAEDLQNRTKNRGSVKVTCAAIAGQPGPATFNRYNLPEVSSLRCAKGLIELFPGLKTVEQFKVDAISPDFLLNPLKLNSEQENMLVVDLPGEELPVLQALQQSQKLHLFNHLILHCGSHALYEGSEPAARVLEWLRNKCFDLVEKNDSVDPDRPYWTLRRNVMHLRYRELQDRLERLTKKNEKLSNDAAASQDRVEKLTKEADCLKKQLKEKEVQIGHLKRASAEQTKLAEDREQQFEGLREDRDKQASLAAEVQAQISKFIQSRDELAKLAGERKARIAGLIKSRDEQAKLVADREQQITELRRDYDKQARLAVERQTQISELINLRDEQAKLARERQTQIDDLTKTQNEHKRWNELKKTQLENLEKEKQQLQQQLQDVKQKGEKSRKTAEDRKQRLEELEQQLAEKNFCQRLLDKELNKAEAQIELIKDILIREKNF